MLYDAPVFFWSHWIRLEASVPSMTHRVISHRVVSQRVKFHRVIPHCVTRAVGRILGARGRRARVGARVGALLLTIFAAPLCTAAFGTELRGFALEAAAGVVLFAPCTGASAGQQSFRLEDKSPAAALSAGMAAVRQIMLDPARPLYVEFQGELSKGIATATRFRRASGQIDSCKSASKERAAGARFAASGEDPTWKFEVFANSARLEVLGSKPVRFPPAAFATPTRDGKAFFFDAWSAQDGGTIRIEVTEQMCSDDRSETAYGARASVRYGSRSFEGCAARF